VYAFPDRFAGSQNSAVFAKDLLSRGWIIWEEERIRIVDEDGELMIRPGMKGRVIGVHATMILLANAAAENRDAALHWLAKLNFPAN
jgi:hypothetical protein